jgi:hypothetical protein
MSRGRAHDIGRFHTRCGQASTSCSYDPL